MPELTQPQIDVPSDETPLEDLRQAAIAEFDNAPMASPAQGRDEKGRFVAQSDAQPTDDPIDDTTDAPSAALFRRVIDVGDGAGAEVFEAESLEDLLDKIADAKANATKKIREQQKELNTLKETAQKSAPTKEFSEDEEFILSQELLSHPTKAIEKIFKEVTGYSIKDFATVKSRMDAIDQTQAKDTAVSTFLASHSDFVDNNKNAKVLGMALQGQPVTSENLHKAYLDLKESGLLELKDESANDGQDDSSGNTMRIAEAPPSNTPSQRTRKASGISTQNRTQPPARRTEPTEEELENMPLDKLRELAMQSF